jgi:Domain of unknown function (DUF4279)
MNDPQRDGDRVLCRVGGSIDTCSASLRLFGDDLDPDFVSSQLGSPPTTACRKGDMTRNKVSTIIEKQGKWLLSIDHRRGTQLEALINELLDKMTGDLTVWEHLTNQFRVDLFCGLQLEEWHRGLSFSPETLMRIAKRRLKLDVGIYFVGDSDPVG